MFGLPAWAIELLVTVLQKTGLVTWAGAMAAKGIVSATQHIEKLKTFQQYPTGKNGT